MDIAKLRQDTKAKSPTFFYDAQACSQATMQSIRQIKALAKKEQKVVRMCLHSSAEDDLHNMVIAHPKGRYVRVHANLSKSKSYHIIEGKLLLVGFNASQKELFRCLLNSQNPICRLSKGVYLFVWPISDVAIFEEVAIGPFQRERDTIFAPWSPDTEDKEGYERFVKKVVGENRV